MFLTRLHRPRDRTPWLQKDAPASLPTTVGGMLAMVIGLSPMRFWSLQISAALVDATRLLEPYAVKLIIDHMAAAPAALPATARLSVLLPWFGFLLAAIGLRFVGAAVVWFGSYHWRPYMRRFSYIINAYVTEHTPHFFESDLSGRIIQKSTSLYAGTKTLIDTLLWNWGGKAVYFVAALAMLASISPWMAVVGITWLSVLFVAAYWLGRHIAASAKVSNEAKSQVVGRLADVITNIRNVLHYARQQSEKQAYAGRESVAINAELRWYLSVLNVRVFNNVMILLAVAGVMGTSIWLWTRGLVTVGDISLAATVILLVAQRANDITDSLPDVLDQVGVIQDSLDTLVKPRDLRDAPDAPGLTPAGGRISFENVIFAYPGAADIYEDFNLDIAAGERVGLVGVSGSGKSTLVSLLLRMYDVQAGAVRIDGQNIALVTQESLRRNIAVIPQDTLLFHRSVRDNIAYGRLDASAEEIETAAHRAQAHEFVMRLPQGYDTMVGERGVKLSGGQRQRIAIARALLKDAPILILDEATSALDSETEMEIQDAIRAAMQGRTVIAIAHRLSTIASLDRLLVMEQGRVIEEGAHAELVARGGVYASLWRRQSGGFLAAA
jgi:ABC-type multidrug transport system fused ATPase/permease subunit